MQTTLLQLCILMTFYMGNLYQSVITSSMTSLRDGVRMKTFSEIFESEFKVRVGPRFYRALNFSDDLCSLIDRMEINHGQLDYQVHSRNKKMLVARCDIFEDVMNVRVDTNLSLYYYMILDKLMQIYEKIFLAATYHNYVFESGIRQHWTDQLKRKEVSKQVEYLLSLDDISGAFYILLTGYVFSLAVFIANIFFSEFWQHLIVEKF